MSELTIFGGALEHVATARCRADGEYEVSCSCGAHWTHKAGETLEQMKLIYESHLRYFTHKKMETL